MNNKPGAIKPVQIILILVGPCTQLSVGSVVDTLNEVNHQAGQCIFQFQLIEVAALSGGRPMLPAAFPTGAADWIVLIGDDIAQLDNEAAFFDMVRRTARGARFLVGVKCGVWWLARAGLLDGYSASVSTSFYDEFAQKYDHVLFNQRMFDIDRNRMTSSGGFATVDLLLTVVAQQHGAVLAELARHALNYPQTRSKQKLQHTTDLSLEARGDARLMEALHIMETNLSDPLQTGDIARLIGLSRRQLERLFDRHLKIAPSVYYLGLRLQQARVQLGLTTKPAAQIGKECGFNSPAYFSYAYRRKYGVSPGDQRRMNDY